MAKIYLLKNTITGEGYVGYTSRKDVAKRTREHFYCAEIFDDRNPKFYSAIRKYGKGAFVTEILYEGEDALDKEDVFIQQFGSYNLAPGGGKFPILPGDKNPFYGKTHSKKSRLKMSESHKINIAIGKENPSRNTGMHWSHTEETRKRMSEAAHKRWQRDIGHSDETKKKISDTKRKLYHG